MRQFSLHVLPCEGDHLFVAGDSENAAIDLHGACLAGVIGAQFGDQPVLDGIRACH
jgi:hypothetical protein